MREQITLPSRYLRTLKSGCRGMLRKETNTGKKRKKREKQALEEREAGNTKGMRLLRPTRKLPHLDLERCSRLISLVRAFTDSKISRASTRLFEQSRKSTLSHPI